MSRAFIRESDDQPERPLSAPRPAALPPGAQNYITPDGARRFQEELERLIQERQRRSAMPEELRELNLRIGHLQRLLDSGGSDASAAGCGEKPSEVWGCGYSPGAERRRDRLSHCWDRRSGH